MTGTELLAMIRRKTKTNSTTYPDADVLADVNVFIAEISSMIVERNNGMFLVPSTFNLVADQREYAFPDDVLNRIHKLEIKFSSGDSRQPATYIKDYLGSETESEITKKFSNTQGEFAYTIRRRAFFILSGTISNVTDGGRVWYHAYPATLTGLSGSTDLSVDPSTTTFGFPKQFHELLARRVSMEYKSSQPKPIPLNALELNYNKDLEIQLDAVTSMDNSGEIVAEHTDPETDFGNDGFNY